MDFTKLKVVDLSSVLAGPSVATFFSELGAEVIKFENKKTGGDVTRTWKLPSEKAAEQSAYFSSVNYNKSYHLVDLKDESDKQMVMSAIEQADIVISNYKHGDDEKLGLDFNTLIKLNPKLIYGAISGFGVEDERIAYDLILQAESGFMAMNGTPDSGPVKMPVALIDVLAAHQLKEGVLIALLKRESSGKGCRVDVSLFDAAVASLVNQASNYLMANHIPKPIGSLHPNIAPYGEIFNTKDNKRLTFAIGSNKQFVNLCKVLKLNNLPNNSKFENNQNRVENRIELYELLQIEISKYEHDILKKQLLKVDVPVGSINNLKEVFTQFINQISILEEDVKSQKTVRVASVAFKISC